MKNKIFDKRIDYNTLKENVIANLDKIFNSSTDEMINAGLKSLTKLDKSSRFISIAKKIDDNYDYYNRKIPILLCSSIILDKYSTTNLDDNSIIIIADISSIYDPVFVDKYMNIFNQELMNELMTKTGNYEKFYGYMFMVEDKYDELVNNENKRIDKKLIQYVKSITDDDYYKFIADTKNAIENFSKGGLKF